MNKNYIFLTILMLVLAVGTFVVKKTNRSNQINPELLLQESIQPARFVSTDQVAKMIIQGDPSLMIIDVRSKEDYQKFSLPHSFNIPLDSLLTTNSRSYFGIPGTKVVFVSNDDIKADQGWVLTKRLGFGSTYVMEGGLNRWMETIIQPQEPAQDEPYTVYEIYSFRKGARLYFTGTKTDNTETSKVKVEFKRREKSNVVAGGC